MNVHVVLSRHSPESASSSGPQGVIPASLSGGWNDDGTSFTIDIDGPLEADRLYVISYTTIPTDGAFTGDRFRNTVTVNGATASAGAGWTAGGGGTGSGERPGQFSIEKVIAGDAADAVPADTAFTVAYPDGSPSVPTRRVARPTSTDSARRRRTNCALVRRPR